MKKGAVVIGGLILGLAVAIFVIFNLDEKYKDSKRRYERDVEGLTRRLIAVSGARATLQKALRKSVRKSAEYKEAAAGYKRLLEEEVERRKALNAEVENIGLLMAAARDEAQNLGAENSTLKMKLNQLEQEKTELNGRLAYFKKIQERLESKIRRLLMRTKVELGQVIVKPSNLNGKVLKANRAYNFVIVDLGKNDGLKPGMTLLAYRQDNPVGEVLIEKVYDELAVGRTLFEWRGDELNVGDAIRGRE